MLTLSNLGLFLCSTPAITLATANVGAGIGGTQITGTTIGEVFPSLTPNAFGGSTINLYNKVFCANGSSTDNAIQNSFWWDNLLTIISGTNTISAFSSSSSDGALLKLRIIGFDNAGNPSLVEIALNGTSTVSTGGATFTIYSRFEVRTVAAPYTLTPLVGTLTLIFNVTPIGFIPAGYYSATTEITMGVEASINGTSTIATAATAPSLTMYAPNTPSSALLGSGTNILTPSDAQGLWWGLSLLAGVKMSQDCQTVFHWRANSTG